MTTLHRSAARRWTRLAQALVLVLIVGAVAMAGVGMPELAPPKALDLDAIRQEANRALAEDTHETDGTGQAADEPQLDVEFLASQLAMIHNAPQPAEVPVEPDDPVDLNNPETAPGSTGSIALVGSVISPTRRVAVLRVDGRQMMIAQGSTRDGIEVLEVGDGFVRLSRDGVPERLDQSPRKSGQLTTLTSPGADSPTPVITPGTRQPPNARSSVQGIDPDAIAERNAQRRAELLRQSRDRELDRARRRGEFN